MKKSIIARIRAQGSHEGKRSHWLHMLIPAAAFVGAWFLAPVMLDGHSLYAPIPQVNGDVSPDALKSLLPWSFSLFGLGVLGAYAMSLAITLAFVNDPLPTGDFAKSRHQVLVSVGGLLIGLGLCAGCIFALIT